MSEDAHIEHEGDDEPQLGPDGKYACGHTPEEHEKLGRMYPVGGVGLTMTMPIEGYDSATGQPIFDMNPDTGYGLLINVEIPGPRSLDIAKNLLTNALGKVQAALDAREAAEAAGEPLTEEQINAAVAGFDPDAAIAGLLGGEPDGLGDGRSMEGGGSDG